MREVLHSAGGVAADGEERRVAQIQQASKTDDHVQSNRQGDQYESARDAVQA